MITTWEQAVAVQTRRRDSGKKGRSKAVRRWFKRTGNALSIEIHDGAIDNRDFHYQLRGDFTGCRRFDEVHQQK
jgi:hypothetical protein